MAERWVTINGHHVLIGDNGEPVREIVSIKKADKETAARLKGTNKTDGKTNSAVIKSPGGKAKKAPEKITSMSQLIPKSINQLKTMYKNTEDPEEKRLIRMALSQQGYKLRDDGKFKDTYKDKYKNK